MTTNEFMSSTRYYALKATFERIWGRGTYRELKNCSDLKVWKRYCERTLRATSLSAKDTVLVADSSWHDELDEAVEHGVQLVQSTNSFDDLFECFAAAYVEISFLQIGLIPNVRSDSRSQLRAGQWNLNAYRTVQYVQDKAQKETLARKIQKRKAVTQ